MDSSEAVTSSEREQAKTEDPTLPPAVSLALKEVAEDFIDEAVPPSRVVFGRPKHVLDMLKLYNHGRKKLSWKDESRWTESFALGVSADGIYCGRLDGKIGLLAVFWRTHNPVVDLRHSLPVPSADGTFVYVCWLWNDFGDEGVQALRDHLESTQIGARFVAHHDQRPRKRGDLVTTPLDTTSADDAVVDRILAERNGHGR